MTDFGRKAALGDMLKSVYDPNADGVIAVAQTEADMKKSVYDTDDDDKVDALDDHASSHEDAGSDEIDITGLVGATALALLGDATAGRVLRGVVLVVADGTTASTLLCILADRWNGDAIASTDNIAKGATTNHFTLSADGQTLTVEAAGLSGNALYAIGSINVNSQNMALDPSVRAYLNHLRIKFPKQADGSYQDITTRVDTGTLELNILYITDA